MAERAAVADALYGKGHVPPFANNSIWRGETIDSCRMFVNAIIHYGKL